MDGARVPQPLVLPLRRGRSGRAAGVAVAGAQYALAYGVAIPLLFLARLEGVVRGLVGSGGS
jgi:hypothetical protein